MKIGELSRRLGLTPPTVRYYESLGLLPRARRVSGSRRYDEEALRSLRLVLALKRAGFSLSEIKALVSLPDGQRSSERWQAVAQSKLADLAQSIAELERAQALLTSSLDCPCNGHGDECVLLNGAGDAAG